MSGLGEPTGHRSSHRCTDQGLTGQAETLVVLADDPARALSKQSPTEPIILVLRLAVPNPPDRVDAGAIARRDQLVVDPQPAAVNGGRVTGTLARAGPVVGGDQVKRVALAEQRLDRVSQFSAGQKAAIKAVGKIALALAHTHRVDGSIVTRDMVAKATGANVDTAGDQLAVFDIEGSPVRRVDKPYGAKTLRSFQLETRDPAEIIERMATLSERLEKRPTATKVPRCRTCPEGTSPSSASSARGAASCPTSGTSGRARPSRTPTWRKTPRCAPHPPGVVEQVTYGGEKRHVADATPPDPDARATAMVDTGAERPIDPWKRPDNRDQEPVDLPGPP